MAPRVLIADKLSPTAVQIFKDRGIETEVKIGLERDALIAIVGNYDGIAVRSATKITEKVIAAAHRLKVIGRAGIGVDNIDVPAATAKGIIVMNTPFGNSITTAEHAINEPLFKHRAWICNISITPLAEDAEERDLLNVSDVEMFVISVL